MRRRGKWQIVASQGLRKSADPPVATYNPNKLSDYAGTYELSPETSYVVSIEANSLFGQRNGRKKEELLPESPDVFFRKGNPSRRLFVRDNQGTVVKMVDRLAGNDLVFTKRTSATASTEVH